MFWKAIDFLRRWEREHLPGADTPQGCEVLLWLLSSRGKRLPLKDLYRSSRFSEPTVRKALMGFVKGGFVVIESNGHDMRSRFARVTPQLEEAVRTYEQRFRDIAALVERENYRPLRPAPRRERTTGLHAA